VRVFTHLASAVRRTFRIAADRPRAGLWTMLALVAAFAACGMAALAVVELERRSSGPAAGTASMVVYLGESVDDAHAQQLTAELAKLSGVEKAELIAPAESARRLEQALGADQSLLDGVEIASLPASVEVTLAAGVRDVVAMSPTVKALRGTPGVTDVVVEPPGEDHPPAMVERLHTTLEVGALVLGGLALIGALAMVRVRLERRPDELAVAQLLGAGPLFQLIPTACAGALLGTIAAALAAGALCVGLWRYGGEVASALAGALGPVQVALPAWPELVVFVAAGALIGFVGGSLAGAARVAR
jgi:cell division protein FtsX